MATLVQKKKFLSSEYKKNPSPTLKKVLELFTYLNEYELSKTDRKEVLSKIDTAFEKVKAKSLPPKQKVFKKEPKGAKSLTQILKEFKAKFGKDKFRQATKDTRDLVKDIERPAIKTGKRIVSKRGYTTNQYGRFKNRVGTTYYETRSNRIDINQPSKTRYPKLAKGGETTMPIQVVIDGDFDEPKYFKTFSLAKLYVMKNYKKHDLEIIDHYGDSIFVEKGSTQEDLDFLFSDEKFAKGGKTLKYQLPSDEEVQKMSHEELKREVAKFMEANEMHFDSDRFKSGGQTKKVKYKLPSKRQVEKMSHEELKREVAKFMEANDMHFDSDRFKDGGDVKKKSIAVGDIVRVGSKTQAEVLDIINDTAVVQRQDGKIMSKPLSQIHPMKLEYDVMYSDRYAKGGLVEGDMRIYVADLKDYNDGKLVGKWIDLSNFSSGEEVMEEITKFLDEQTKKDKHGEVHEEYAIHDIDGVPRGMYHESMSEQDFDNIYDALEVADEKNIPIQVLLQAQSDLGYDDLEEISEMYETSVGVSMGNEWRDFAHEYVAELGMSNIANKNWYFDFESYGADVRSDYDEEELIENGWEDYDDEQLGEEVVEMSGGIDSLGEETIDSYFDYERFGRDLEHDFISIRHDGRVYFFRRNYAQGGTLAGDLQTDNIGFAKGGEVAKSNKQMVLSKAKEVKHHADELQHALKNEKDIEAWVVSKVQRASTDLSDVTHYLDGKSEYGDGGTLAGSLDVDNVGFGIKRANGGMMDYTEAERKQSLKNNGKLKL